MASPETLSVRLSAETRQILDDVARAGAAAGASALARDILEAWAAERRELQAREGAERIVSYLKAHPDGWADEPADFFPAAAEQK